MTGIIVEARARCGYTAARERAEAERQREQGTADRIAALTDEADIAEAQHQAIARTGAAAAAAVAATVQAEARAARSPRFAPARGRNRWASVGGSGGGRSERRCRGEWWVRGDAASVT